MVRADIPLAVTRLTTAGVGIPLECEQWPGHRRGRTPEIFEQCLDILQARECVPRRGAFLPSTQVGIARQTSLLELLLWRDIRQGSQILIQADRTDHSSDVRSLRTGSILRRIGASRLLRSAGALGLGERARTNQRHKDAEEAKNGSN